MGEKRSWMCTVTPTAVEVRATGIGMAETGSTVVVTGAAAPVEATLGSGSSGFTGASQLETRQASSAAVPNGAQRIQGMPPTYGGAGHRQSTAPLTRRFTVHNLEV